MSDQSKQKPGEIMEQIAENDRLINQLHSLIGDIYNMLRPVLRDTDEKVEERAEPGGRTELGYSLQRQSRDLTILHEQMKDIVERTELPKPDNSTKTQ